MNDDITDWLRAQDEDHCELAAGVIDALRRRVEQLEDELELVRVQLRLREGLA